MKLRWIYLALMVAVVIPTFLYQQAGSTEVASHSYGHLIYAAVFGLGAWLIRRPVSGANLWMWRGMWGISGAQWLEAVGAFGYEDRATSAVPGLNLVHNLAAPAAFFASFLVVVGAGVALLWTRLPRPVGIAFTVVLSGATRNLRL